jgi:hypothetical protein
VWYSAVCVVFVELACGCTPKKEDPMNDIATLSRELMVHIPVGATVLGVDRERGHDDMVRAKFEIDRASFDTFVTSLPMASDMFSRGPGRLGSDAGYWNPKSTPGIRSAQVILPSGRGLHVGFADSGDGGVVVFVMNHGL